jgi:asparagine synthetase B (glutamine-hydrolysing)
MTQGFSSARRKAEETPFVGRWLVSCAVTEESFAANGQAGAHGLALAGEGAGRPPELAADAVRQVLFDGLLYNRAELQARYGNPAAPDDNDAGLLLQVYRRRGEHMVQELKGIFALLIWDRENRCVLAAHDATGLYPLYYAEVGREWLFTNTLSELRRHPRFKREFNRPALAEHLNHRWPDKEETFYLRTWRLPPGHLVSIAEGRRKSARYWDPAPPDAPIEWVREEELERFDDLLRQAVSRLLELGPAGIYLSGGLDSVSVAAFAEEQSRQKGLPIPQALSVIFPGEANEMEVQKGVAHKLGFPQHFVEFNQVTRPRGLLWTALEQSRRMSKPLLNVFSPAYAVLAEQAKGLGCRSIFTGGGGDDWLNVSPFYAADLLRRGDFAGMYRLWETQRRSFPLSPLRLFYQNFWQFSARPLLGAAAHRLLRGTAPALHSDYQRWRRLGGLPAWLAPAPALRRELGERVARFAVAPEAESFYVRHMRTALDHCLIGWELEEIFERGQLQQAPLLQPYWDAELVTLLYRIHPDQLLRGGRSKGMVRGMLARQFPHLGFERQKKVLAVKFFRATVLDESLAVRRSLGSTRLLADLGLVEPQTLDRVVERILTKRYYRGAHTIWETLNLEIWLRAQLEEA